MVNLNGQAEQKIKALEVSYRQKVHDHLLFTPGTRTKKNTNELVFEATNWCVKLSKYALLLCLPIFLLGSQI